MPDRSGFLNRNHLPGAILAEYILQCGLQNIVVVLPIRRGYPEQGLPSIGASIAIIDFGRAAC